MFKYLSSAVVAVFLAVMVSGPAVAQTENPSEYEHSELLQVAFGAYVLRMSNVSPQLGSADVDFWIWFRWKDGDIRPDLSFELTNGVIISRSESEFLMDGDYKLASVRVHAQMCRWR
jgi:hypothetical protein